MRWIVVVLTLLIAPSVWAHPGDLDACLGHVVEEYTQYPVMADGVPSVDSEPGEYHLHFSPDQMAQEALPSLREYKRVHPASTELGIDHGSFIVAGNTYAILQYTHQQEAILRCEKPDGLIRIGIVRIRQ